MLKYDAEGNIVEDGQPWVDPNATVDANPYSQSTAFEVAAKRVKKGVQHEDYKLPVQESDISPYLMHLRNKAIGAQGEERYQFWPEAVVRSGLNAIPDAMSGKLGEPGSREFTEAAIPRAMDMAAMAGGGGLVTGAPEGAVAAGAVRRIGPKPTSPFKKGEPPGPPKSFEEALSNDMAGHGEVGIRNYIQQLDTYKSSLEARMTPAQLEKFRADYPEHSLAIPSKAEIEAKFGELSTPKNIVAAKRSASLDSAAQDMMDWYESKGAKGPTLLSDTNIAAPIAAISKPNKMGFFSATEKAIADIPQAKMTGDQWLGTLANKPGVKGEELDATGLREFLKGKGSVSKEEVSNYIKDNKVELREVVKGKFQNEKEYQTLQNKILNKAASKEEEIRYRDLHKEREKYAITQNTTGLGNTYIESLGDNTKYSKYQLPGSENYREVLMTLPRKDMNLKNKWSDLTESEKIKITKDHKEFMDDMKGDDFFDNDPSMKSSHDPKTWYEDIIAPTTDVQRKQVNMGNTYKSSHWGEPNVIAHMRMNDRTIDGKKSLHLEEIQSDWHQQGRDKGYKGTLSDKELNERGMVSDKSLVPDAPFKKTWHELALKRALYEAAQKGYDRLSWTPGEAQAARYDLSKQVENIKYIKNNDNTYDLLIKPKENYTDVIRKDKLTEKDLDAHVGKEIATKIIKNEGIKSDTNAGVTTLSNIDLKVGGEGMKGFYDKMIPAAVEKLGKEFGVKVKEGNIKAGGKITDTTRETKHPIHYIDLPQAMKDKILEKGFPLFSAPPPIMTPVQGNPFTDQKKKYKLVPVSHNPFESNQ